MTVRPIVALPDCSTRIREASRLILLLGLVSLFADATYESARSILGPYLAALGANGAVVGMIAGSGELIGYGLRVGSGYVADRTGRYWGLSLLGFVLNMTAVPLLALTGRWESVAALNFLERSGKAIRNPPRDAILSHAADHVGRGWGFGLQEALGQIGAVIGPLAIAIALHFNAHYRTCLAGLSVPAALTLICVAIGARNFPEPQVMEPMDAAATDRRLPRSYWPFLAAAGLIAAGSLDFPLVAYHIHQRAMLPAKWIPALYAMAMCSHAISALGFGLLFDRMGMPVLLCACVLTAPIAPMVFWGRSTGLIVAMILWGVGLGAQKAMFKATIARMAPADRRGFAYGCFDFGYGLSWFLGSALMGFCYGRSMTAVVAISVGTQLLAIPMLLIVVRWATGTVIGLQLPAGEAADG